MRVPEELQGAIPRDVRLSRGGIVLTAIGVAVAVAAVASAILLSAIYDRQNRQRDVRAREAVAARAEVARVGLTHGDHPRQVVTYRYVVGGRRYSARATFGQSDRHDVIEGREVPIAYLASDPAVSWMIGNEPQTFPLLLIPLVPAVLVFGAVAIAFGIRRQWMLLSEGRVALARITALTKVYHKDHRGNRVAYEFQALSGATRTGSYESAKTPPPIGTILPIIYHRDDPGWNARYPLQLVRPVRVQYTHASRLLLTVLLVTLGLGGWTAAQTSEPALAPTPPMGWNSWDAFGTTVTEDEVKANAGYMAAHLKRHGWQYIVVDIQWSEPNPKAHGYRPNADLVMDGNGRLVPAPNRFPSSADGKGFKPLADYVHAKGLKFGIHIMRGIPRRAVDANVPIANSTLKAADVADRNSTCPWNTDMYGVDVQRGGQAYYDSILQLYASWGVDFIKADDMFGAGPRGDHSAEIGAVSAAIRKSGRPIVLSLSPGTHDTTRAEFIAQHAQMWRISDDFWDRWIDLKNQFKRLDTWRPYAKPGNWPDADMLPLGRIGIRAERGDPRTSRLTHDEQLVLMTLWSIARSPLMFGGNLPDNDSFTLSLLTNDEVLAVNQEARSSKQLFARDNQVAWVAEIAGSPAKYLAVFNIGDTASEDVLVNWADLGLPAICDVRDLWAHKDLGSSEAGRAFVIRPHAAGFYRVTPAR